MNNFFKIFIKKVDLISLFFLAFSILLLVYVIYRAQYVYSGNLGSYYYKYYLFSYICIFASITSIFFSIVLKRIIILLISSFLVAFYIIEGGLIFLNNYEVKMQLKKEENETKFKIEEFKKIENKIYDTRQKIDVYKDLKKKNLNVTVGFTPSIISISNDKVIFPLSQTSSHITTIDCNENGYYSKYLSDRYGYNNPDIEWNKNKHILLIGDSFVNGSCVNEIDTISSNLRNLINKKDVGVLNLGVGNTGPLIHLAILKEYIKKTKPNKIFWFYYEGNDLDNLKDELENSILRKYLYEHNFIQNISLYQDEIDKIYLKKVTDAYNLNINPGLRTQEQSEKNIFIRTLTFNLIRKTIRQFLYTPPIAEFNKILIEAKRLANEHNTELNIVYLPGYYRYENNEKKNTLNLSYYQKIISMFKSLNLNIIDFKFELDNHKDVYSLFPFRIHGHFNPNGTAYVSNVIFKNSFINK